MATQSWVIPTPRTQDLPAVSALRVELTAGSLAVARHDREHVHLAVDEVTGPAAQITVTDGHALFSHQKAGAAGLWQRLVPSPATGSVALRLYLPAEVRLSVSAGAAETTVEGLDTDMDLSSTSARLTVRDSAGALESSTRSGDIVVRDHHGDLRAATLTGMIDAAGHMPLVEISSGSSDLWLTNDAADSRTTLNSAAGACHLRLGQDVPVRVSATKLGGSITVDGKPVHFSGGSAELPGAAAGIAELRVSMLTGSLNVVQGAS